MPQQNVGLVAPNQVVAKNNAPIHGIWTGTNNGINDHAYTLILRGDGSYTTYDFSRPRGTPNTIYDGQYDRNGNQLNLRHSWGIDTATIVNHNANQLTLQFRNQQLTFRNVFQTARMGALTPVDQLDRRGRRFDVLQFNLVQGRNYTFDLVSNQFDTYLRIEDMQGNLLASNDDGGLGLNSRLRFTPNANGPFRIVVTSFGAGERGDYVLTIKK